MKQPQDGNQFNIFLSDDEVSLLSRPSGPPQQKNIFIAKGKGRIQGPELNNPVYGKENNNIIKYTALIYGLLSIYSVGLGVKAFLEEDEKVIYFYDLPFLGSRYFKVCVSSIAFCGLVMVETIYLAYSNVSEGGW